MNGGSDKQLSRYAWLSIAAALATMGLKASAYLITRSVGLLSDALESGVNLAGAVMALAMLKIAVRPPDEEHAYGHFKAEYFSSGLEGALILAAAVSIAYSGVNRLLHPQPLQKLSLGLIVSLAAGLINLGTALILLRQSRAHQSITLQANGQHLLTDVWTSLGVAAGVGAVALTGWSVLDPLIALALAVNISWTGIGILRDTVQGLMDTSLPEGERKKVLEVLDRYRTSYPEEQVRYHAVRTRTAASKRFVSFHLLVPGSWTVQEAHQLVEDIERDIFRQLGSVTFSVHIEPLGDPASWKDAVLDREYRNQEEPSSRDGSNQTGRK
jgi:cation diffusion facilitator family transporter